MATRDKPGRILAALAIVLTPLTGSDQSDLPLLSHAFDNSKAKLPPMPGSLPYLYRSFRRWLRAKFGTPERSNGK
jgi:hypothetical protein